MVRARLLTGATLIAGFLLLVWLDTRWVGGPLFHLLAGALMVCGLLEFCALAERAGGQPLKVLSVALVAALVALDYALRVAGDGLLGGRAFVRPATLLSFYAALGLTTTIGFALLAVVNLFLRAPQRSLTDLSVTCLGFLYIWVLGSHVLAIRALGMAQVLVFLAVAKLGDAGAYFAGLHLGRHKLAPRTSPKKTIEGALGGLVVSAAAALLLAPALGLGGTVGFWAAFGLVVGLVAQVGDLVESALKRSVGAKDSGGFIPTFGGVLDVIDSPLLGAPVAFWLLVAAWPTLQGGAP